MNNIYDTNHKYEANYRKKMQLRVFPQWWLPSWDQKNEQKFTELSAQKRELLEYYKINEKGFYACRVEGKEEKRLLQSLF